MICEIEYTKIYFCLTAAEDTKIPSYLGSTIRGGIGTSLKNRFCKYDFGSDCSNCIDKINCKYIELFSNRIDKETAVRNPETQPNPFIIEPPSIGKTYYSKGDMLTFGLTLVGDAVTSLQYYIDAVKETALNGLGAGRYTFEFSGAFCNGVPICNNSEVDTGKVNSTKWINTDEIEQNEKYAKELTISFLTPVRLAENKRILRGIEFQLLMKALFRRGSSMAELYCNKKWDIRYDDYLKRASTVKIKKHDLKWFELERFSNRFQRKLDISGLKGSITYSGDVSIFMPFIRMGSIIYVGKSCTMGLGKYEIIQEAK